METWKTRYCKLGQGSLCCQHLVINGKNKYACNKLVAQDDTGVKNFALVEENFEKSLKNYWSVRLSIGGDKISSIRVLWYRVSLFAHQIRKRF